MLAGSVRSVILSHRPVHVCRDFANSRTDCRHEESRMRNRTTRTRLYREQAASSDLDGVNRANRHEPGRASRKAGPIGLAIGTALAALGYLVVGCASPGAPERGPMAIPGEYEGIRINGAWMRCAANFAATQAEKCAPRCDRDDYALVAETVADYCGGSDVQERGGYLLSRIWMETMRLTGGDSMRE